MRTYSTIKEEQIHGSFQPIYTLSNWEIVGYDFLLECDRSQSKDSSQTKLYQFDSTSIYRAMFYYHKEIFKNSKTSLYLNTSPITILNPKFPTILNRLIKEFSEIENIVFQICYSEIENSFDSLKIRNIFNEFGFDLALKDVGIEKIDENKLIKLRPKTVKLNKYLTRDLDKSIKKQNAVKEITDYYLNFNINSIIQSIETPAELATAKYIGVPFGQGNVLANFVIS